MCSGIRWTIRQGFYEYYEGTEHFQQQPHLLLSTPFHPETVHLCGLFVTVVPIELCNVCVCFILVSLLLWEISIACLSVIDSIFFWYEQAQFSSVQSLNRVRLFATHGLQHARPPGPSPILRVYSDSCPSSQWCHPTISSSVVPFSSRLQSFLVSRPFLMSQFFISGSQSIGVSASTSVLPMNTQDWSPVGRMD